VSVSHQSLALDPASPQQFGLHLYWSRPARQALRGFNVAREGNYLFAWDEDDFVHLLNAAGHTQSRAKIPGRIVAAAAADCGGCFVAVTREGDLFVLNTDLSVRRKTYLRSGICAAAVDAHGNYLLFSDLDGGLGLAELDGHIVWLAAAPCTYVYLAFMPILPFVLAGSRMGPLACYDIYGHQVWNRGTVCHVGGLALRGADGHCALACFSEGAQHYSYAGKDLGRRRLTEPCRLIAVPFASNLFLTAGFSSRLNLVDEGGSLLAQAGLHDVPSHLAVSAAGDLAFLAYASGEMAAYAISRPRTG
jgi:hypothetical protein